jgi:hypothetical protein
MFLYQRTSDRKISRGNSLKFLSRLKEELNTLEAKGPEELRVELTTMKLAINRALFKLEMRGKDGD